MKSNNSKGTKIRNFLFFIFTFSFLIISTSLWGAFSRDSSGVVADSKSGLAWQDNYVNNGGDIKSATWQDALVYCHEITLGGQSDWRLPNIRELKSIVDDSKFNPAINSIFQNFPFNNYVYVSSTTDASDSSNVWDVNFYNGGSTSSGSKTDERLVRCVRGGQ